MGKVKYLRKKETGMVFGIPTQFTGDPQLFDFFDHLPEKGEAAQYSTAEGGDVPAPAGPLPIPAPTKTLSEELGLEEMSKKELKAFAMEQYNTEIRDKGVSKIAMIDRVLELFHEAQGK